MNRIESTPAKIGLALITLLSFALSSAQALAASAPSEPVRTVKQAPDLRLKQTAGAAKTAAPPYRIQLPAVADEAAALGAQRPDKALKIGFARAIPAAAQALDSDQRLNWQASRDGGHFARVEVAAEGAAGIRFELRIIALPASAELRFYTLAQGVPEQARWLTTGRAIHKLLNHRYLADRPATPDLGYWSPTLPGDQVGFEIYLPPGTPPQSVHLAITRLSQLLALPGSKDTANIGNSGFCQVDLACEGSTWGDTGTSIAKMTYIENGDSFLCTGTLINDLDNSSQRPLFLSAEHCIDTQDTASTLETFWFFQRRACFSTTLDDWIQLSGGAQLLSHGSASDYSLMELNDTPPNGARFAGWTSDPQSRFQNVTVIHHPNGDLKKISSGMIVSIQDDFLNPRLDAPITVSWNTGTTEGGSSGSPLFNTSKQLIGTLWGGLSSCSNRSANDLFGRFELTEKSIKDELIGGGGGTTDARISTLASRAWVGTGDQVMIAGILTRGSGEARIVARGVGPSLSSAGLIDLLPDPRLQLFSGQTLIAENDDWGSTEDVQTIIDAGLRPDNPLEAALLRTLTPGPYTVILRDNGSRTGIGGLAVDDLELPDGMRLEAISTRALIEGGDKVLIAGFRITGGEKVVVLRAFGPSLGNAPNSGLSDDQLLHDPVLEVFSGSTLIGSNDDWRSTSGASLIQANGLAPESGLESAILMTLAPGDYTVIAKGLGGSTGIGGVAVNELP